MKDVHNKCWKLEEAMKGYTMAVEVEFCYLDDVLSGGAALIDIVEV